MAIEAISAIGIKNGPSHTELKITPCGVKVVEIAARLGGDFITSKLVPLSTGVDMIECTFSTLLGKTVDVEIKKKRGSAIRIIQGKKGTIKSVEGINVAQNMPGIIDVELYKGNGDIIREPENSGDRIGHVIAIGTNAEEAAQRAEAALNNIKVITGN